MSRSSFSASGNRSDFIRDWRILEKDIPPSPLVQFGEGGFVEVGEACSIVLSTFPDSFDLLDARQRPQGNGG
jgi:hypothetical protein